MQTTSSVVYLTPPDPGERAAWTTETKGRGDQWLSILDAVPSDVELRVLETLATRELVARRRVMSLDGRPVEVATSYYPASIAQGTALAEPRKIKGGAVRLLADLGWTPARVIEDVGAAGASQQDAELLGIPPDSPVLVMHRTSMDHNGHPFEYLHTVACDGRFHRYVMELA